jgi:sugar/nucleoside kinase (ribokinase family)
MFEICYLDDSELPEPLNQEVCNYLLANAGNYDLVLVADFGHGLIGRKLAQVLCDKAKFLAVNTQTNSANAGFNLITKYPRADYICIDEPEIRLACHDKFDNLKDLAIRIAEELKCNRITITRGLHGSLTYATEDGFFEIPALSEEVIDRVGAGDAYFSITSPCVAAGNPMEMVGFIGNAVGALKVRIVCNRASVESVPLSKFITALLK